MVAYSREHPAFPWIVIARIAAFAESKQPKRGHSQHRLLPRIALGLRPEVDGGHAGIDGRTHVQGLPGVDDVQRRTGLGG